MSIQVKTGDPQGLLNSIYGAIDDESIKTWAYDKDKDFFHNTSNGQWKGKAWLHPTVVKGALVLAVIPPTTGLSMRAYAVYHGRFIEMLLAHFDGDFTEAFVTAQATGDDRV